MTAGELIDKVLADIIGKKNEIDRWSADMEAEMAIIRAKYVLPIESAQKHLTDKEKILEALVKKHRAEILRDSDRADLPHGAVLLKIEKRVKRIRDMLDRLEASGKTDLVKTVKSVDWDLVEKLTDPELKALGTKRVPKDRFAYELKP